MGSAYSDIAVNSPIERQYHRESDVTMVLYTENFEIYIKTTYIITTIQYKHDSFLSKGTANTIIITVS